MRHSLILILICLLLGAITTLALAWMCAAFVDPDHCQATFDHSPRSDGGDDVAVMQRGFGHSRINRAQCSLLVLDDQTGNIKMARWQSGGESSSETCAGWPFRAFSCVNPSQVSLVLGGSMMRVSGSGIGQSVQGGWELSPFPGGRLGSTWRGIPLRPMWGGLLADGLVLGGMWWMLLGGVTAMRRKRRRAAGRCPNCGYDLRSGGVAHERCPECGHACLASPASPGR